MHCCLYHLMMHFWERYEHVCEPFCYVLVGLCQSAIQHAILKHILNPDMESLHTLLSKILLHSLSISYIVIYSSAFLNDIIYILFRAIYCTVLYYAYFEIIQCDPLIRAPRQLKIGRIKGLAVLTRKRLF